MKRLNQLLRILLSSGMLALCAAGCTTDGVDDSRFGRPGAVELVLGVSVSGDKALSRAMTAGQESEVAELTALVFGADDDGYRYTAKTQVKGPGEYRILLERPVGSGKERLYLVLLANLDEETRKLLPSSSDVGVSGGTLLERIVSVCEGRWPAQNAQGERVRYCGSPLKYSFSEARQQKSLTVVELGEKGALRVSTRPLTPRRDLCEIRGTLEEVTSRAFYESVDAQAYMHVVLTDEEDAPGALARLRAVYPNLLRVSRDNRVARSLGQLPAMEEAAAQSPLELFAAFYERRNGAPLSGAQKDILQKLIANIWEGEGCGQ